MHPRHTTTAPVTPLAASSRVAFAAAIACAVALHGGCGRADPAVDVRWSDEPITPWPDPPGGASGAAGEGSDGATVAAAHDGTSAEVGASVDATAPDPRCPDDMVHVPAGAFRGGALGTEIDYYADWPDTEHLPRAPGQRTTDAFCIDRYEYPNREGELPRAFVSWDEALALCRERGRRLCTEDEWTKACAGETGQLFPYGNRYVKGVCNADVDDKVGDPGWLRPSGAFPRCVSPYGAVDMEGNLSEWVDAVSDEVADQRIIRGGTMWLGVYGRGCMARHRHHHADASHEDDGVRCCREPAGQGSGPGP